jgi:hypothetical protein
LRWVRSITVQALNFFRQIVPRLAAIENCDFMPSLQQRMDNRGPKISCTTNDQGAHERIVFSPESRKMHSSGAFVHFDA